MILDPLQPMAALTAIDIVVVLAYAVLVIWIALRARTKTENTEDYLVGGRTVPWFAVAMSWVATSFSALALLQFTGLGHAQGFTWIQMWLGELPALAVLLLVFLPFFQRLKITTAYEYLGQRFGDPAWTTGSVIFHFMALVRAGLMLVATSTALAVFTGWSVDHCILAVGLLAVMYSAFGGLKAVVWTDVVQFVCIAIGLIGSFIVVTLDLPGGFGDIARAARVLAEEKPVINTSADFGTWPTMLTTMLGYSVFALSLFGTNQQLVQRYVSCKDLAASRRAAVAGWIAGLVVGMLTVGLGVALFALYGADPVHLGESVNQDEIFSFFIADRLPPGMAGLMVAVLFAATMSSVDSAVHSLGTATLVDFLDRGRTKPLDPSFRLRLARGLTLAYGFVVVGAAFMVQHGDHHILKRLWDWLGLLAGPLLGLFLLGMLTRHVTQRAALGGMVAGYVAAFLYHPLSARILGRSDVGLASNWGMSSIFTAAVGCLVTCVAALILGIFQRPHPREGR